MFRGQADSKQIVTILLPILKNYETILLINFQIQNTFRNLLTRYLTLYEIFFTVLYSPSYHGRDVYSGTLDVRDCVVSTNPGGFATADFLSNFDGACGV